MKRRFIYFLVATSLLLQGVVLDFLDPVRNTNVLTSEDIANNVDVNPALVEGSLNGIGSLLIEPAGITGTRHYDLGQKGVDIWLIFYLVIWHYLLIHTDGIKIRLT